MQRAVMPFLTSWTLRLGANANHSAKLRNPVTSARLPVAQQVNVPFARYSEYWITDDTDRFHHWHSKSISSVRVGVGCSVWSVSRLIAQIVVQGRRRSYRRLTKIQTRGTFTISTITIHNISPWQLSPCYWDMVRPRVANGGDGFHTWRVAANIFSKQKRTTDGEVVL